MAEAKVDSVVVNRDERAIVVKALQVFRKSRERAAAAEIPGSSLRELLLSQVADIEQLEGRFR
jgi:hypothetical protein